MESNSDETRQNFDKHFGVRPGETKKIPPRSKLVTHESRCGGEARTDQNYPPMEVQTKVVTTSGDLGDLSASSTPAIDTHSASMEETPWRISTSYKDPPMSTQNPLNEGAQLESGGKTDKEEEEEEET